MRNVETVVYKTEEPIIISIQKLHYTFILVHNIKGPNFRTVSKIDLIKAI